MKIKLKNWATNIDEKGIRKGEKCTNVREDLVFVIQNQKQSELCSANQNKINESQITFIYAVHFT